MKKMLILIAVATVSWYFSSNMTAENAALYLEFLATLADKLFF